MVALQIGCKSHVPQKIKNVGSSIRASHIFHHKVHSAGQRIRSLRQSRSLMISFPIPDKMTFVTKPNPRQELSGMAAISI